MVRGERKEVLERINQIRLQQRLRNRLIEREYINPILSLTRLSRKVPDEEPAAPKVNRPPGILPVMRARGASMKLTYDEVVHVQSQSGRGPMTRAPRN